MKVLVCPLNWGLGHAARCVPIIKNLIEEGSEVTIVSDGFPLAFLRNEFPTLPYIEYPSYSIHYSSGKSQVGAMLSCLPGVVKKIIAEHHWLKKLLKEHHFDMVISDNRFGMWSKQTKSVYITHQLMVKMPRGLRGLEPAIWRIHRVFIHRYDECWIPDYKDAPGLSGDLSHKYPLPENAKFVGPLSRFSGLESIDSDACYETVAVISGVEPQRSLFEREIIDGLKFASHKVLIVRGQPAINQQVEQINQITILSHMDTEKLAAVMLGAKRIVTRSGYSTIMDLAILKCLNKARFIPTPGQTEQEYLANLHRSD